MPSNISGVGVFAIKLIPQGTDPFVGCFSDEYIEVTSQELQTVDLAVQAYVKDICAFQEGKYFLPSCGIPRIDMSFFLNHSFHPNMQSFDLGDKFMLL